MSEPPASRCPTALRGHSSPPHGSPLDLKLLIDAILRQTTVLIGQLSTSAGVRAPLAHLADEVFLRLSTELEAQGLSRKVVADMFGMALRGYQRRLQRLRESATAQGKTLWQSTLEQLQSEGSLTRRDLIERFGDDDPEAVGAVLNDLVSSGLARKTGHGYATQYSITPDSERQALARAGNLETASALAWLELCRCPGITREELQERVHLDADTLGVALSQLEGEGRVKLDADGHLEAEALVIPVGTEQSWAIALFDHYRAVCTAMTTKLRMGGGKSSAAEKTGGATWTFEVSAKHPRLAEVEALLKKTRDEVQALWLEVEAHNAVEAIAPLEVRRVTFYCGQYVQEAEVES